MVLKCGTVRPLLWQPAKFRQPGSFYLLIYVAVSAQCAEHEGGGCLVLTAISMIITYLSNKFRRPNVTCSSFSVGAALELESFQIT